MKKGFPDILFPNLTHSGRNRIALKLRSMASFVLPAILVPVLCIFSFRALQNDYIYHNAGKLIIRNYYHTSEGINKGEVPFVAFSNNEMLHWDAEIYNKIRKNGYDLQSAGGDYIFAFFPLFPALWKLSHLTPVGISIVNYLFFVISVIILTKITCTGNCSNPGRNMIVWLGIPMLAVFLIPYTEGLFMLTSTLALYGLVRGRYSIYFTGALLMSMTRPSVIIIAAAIFLAEVYDFIMKGKLKKFLSALSLRLLPVVSGTAIVALIQLFYGSGSVFKFLEVQKYWNSSLRLPEGLTDWAHEQFSSNLALVILTIPIVIYIAGIFIKGILSATGKNFAQSELTGNEQPGFGVLDEPGRYKGIKSQEYLFVLSMMYIAGTVLSVVFMRGGSLNGLSRYIICTPFFYIALSEGSQKLMVLRPVLRLLWFLAFFVLTVTVLSSAGYSKNWNFSDTGFLIFYSQVAWFIFPRLQKSVIFIMIHILLVAVWTSYLLNMFLSGVWIFT